MSGLALINIFFVGLISLGQMTDACGTGNSAASSATASGDCTLSDELNTALAAAANPIPNGGSESITITVNCGTPVTIEVTGTCNAGTLAQTVTSAGTDVTSTYQNFITQDCQSGNTIVVSNGQIPASAQATILSDTAVSSVDTTTVTFGGLKTSTDLKSLLAQILASYA